MQFLSAVFPFFLDFLFKSFHACVCFSYHFRQKMLPNLPILLRQSNKPKVKAFVRSFCLKQKKNLCNVSRIWSENSVLLAQQPAILVLCSFTQKKLSNQFALFFGTSNFRVTLCWQGKAGEHFTWKQLQIYGGGGRLSPSGIRHLADPKGPPFILVWNIHFWLAREIPREIFAPLVKFLDPPLLARFISGIIIFLVKFFYSRLICCPENIFRFWEITTKDVLNTVEFQSYE